MLAFILNLIASSLLITIQSKCEYFSHIRTILSTDFHNKSGKVGIMVSYRSSQFSPKIETNEIDEEDIGEIHQVEDFNFVVNSPVQPLSHLLCKNSCTVLGSSKLEIKSTRKSVKDNMIHELLEIDGIPNDMAVEYECSTTVENEESSKLSQKFVFNFFKGVITKDKESSKLFKFRVLGDWGQGDAGDKTLKLLSENKDDFDIFLFLGDMAYNLESSNGEVGNLFMKKIQQITSSSYFFTTPGNHEKKSLFVDYKVRFPVNSNLYYSFDYKGIHFVSLNSNVIVKLKNGQSLFDDSYVERMLKWVEDDLEQSKKDGNKLNILFNHHNYFTSFNYKNYKTSGVEMQKKFEKILGKFNLVFSGHFHIYERTASIPLTSSVTTNKSQYYYPKSPIFFTCGTGGNSEIVDAEKIENPQDFTLKWSNENGVCEFEVDNDYNIKGRFLSSSNKVVDEFEIINFEADGLPSETLNEQDQIDSQGIGNQYEDYYRRFREGNRDLLVLSIIIVYCWIIGKNIKQYLSSRSTVDYTGVSNFDDSMVEMTNRE